MSFLTEMPPWKPKAGGGGGVSNDHEEHEWTGGLPVSANVSTDPAFPVLWHREYIDRITAGSYSDQRETRYFGRQGSLLRLPRVALVQFASIASITAGISPDDDVYLSNFSNGAFGLPVESVETVHPGVDDNGDAFSFSLTRVDPDSFIGGKAVLFVLWAGAGYLHVASNTFTHYHYPDIAVSQLAEVDEALESRFERVKLYIYRTHNDPTSGPAALTAGEFSDLTNAYQSVANDRIELVTGTQFESALYNTDPVTVTNNMVASDVIPKIQQFFSL